LQEYRQQNSSPDNSSSLAYTRREAAIIAASRMIKDGDVVFVGQGLPVIASVFAKHRHANDSVILNEYGVVDTNPPVAVELAHPMLAETAIFLCDMVDALACLIYHVNISLLGAAQIDRYGNVNTTSIGNYFHPKLRISGSGGANDIGSLSPKFILLMDDQKASKFPERVDYVTTPGFFRGSPQERRKNSLSGGGPEAVITDLGIYKFTEKTGEMYLYSLHPGVSLEEVMEKTGWNLRTTKKIGKVQAPIPEEIEILRSLDPRKVYLK
jgi:glutaconate CoA-transferase subunit B